MPNSPHPSVLADFDLQGTELVGVETGLINRTWLATTAAGATFVLQRVNPMFDPRVHHDIERVTAHLAAAGLVTPRLVPARSGALFVEHGGACWRLLTYVEGVTRDSPIDTAQARSAGALLGRFHAALDGARIELLAPRPGVHDTGRHLNKLQRALAEHSEHPAHAEADALAAEISALAGELPVLPEMPNRLVHGDPKFSNLVLDAASGEARALIDLDTLTHMPVALELGDAMRSWCNPGAEDAADATFSGERFAAALEGYAAGSAGLVTDVEARAIPAATLTIAVELAARFCADALAERYFGWDASRYASASAHNLARARGQLGVAAAIAAALPTLDAHVRDAFAGRA